MSLDNNLFTLWMIPSEQSPGDSDCIDPQSSEVVYRKRRRTAVKGPEYFWSLLDPVSDAMLATVTATGATNKTKIITLHDPDVPVQLTFTGTVSFKWSFVWETHEFEWRKDSCYLIRKPDPPVQVAVTDPAKKGRPASVQVLDYNLRRFEIEDRKGLEIVMLCALLTFADYSEGHQKPPTSPTAVSAGGNRIMADSRRNSGPLSPGPLSPPPPVPQIQVSSDPNEVIVTEEGTVAEYANHCASVLADKDILFIVIRSSSPDVVPRVVQIAQETKRLRHRADEDDEELYQYVTYDQEKDNPNAKKKSKRVIKLDDASEPSPRKDPSYKPLTTLTIHLSKIPMPELAPQGAPPTSRPRPPSTPSSNRPKPSQGRPSPRPSPAPSPTPSASRPSVPQQQQQQPARLQKPASGPGQSGRHGRSSSAEPRPRPAGGSQNPNNNLSPNAPRLRPTSSYGNLNAGPYPQQPSPVNGTGAPQMPVPRPVTPVYPTQLPPQQQQQPPPAQPHSGAMGMLGKLLGRI